MQAGAIKFMGAMSSPVDGDLKIPMVTTSDIAAVGLRHMLSLSFCGKNVDYALGSRDVSYNEIAGIYGAAIGKPDPAQNYVGFLYSAGQSGAELH